MHHGSNLLGRGEHDRIPHVLHGPELFGGAHDEHSSLFLIRNHLHAASLFKAFMQLHNRTYDTLKEFGHRFTVFRQNLVKVAKLQRQEKGSATYGLSKFADRTAEEFQQILGFRPTHRRASPYRQVAAPTNRSAPLPKSFDWRDHGAVTPVKNQGSCGSCWAFSTTGNVEGQWFVKKNELVSLSEQELVDCDSEDHGCNGGLPENAYDAIIKLGGLETEDEYPYDAHDDACSFDRSKARVYVNGSVELPQDEHKLAEWLVEHGPISIGINANALQFYWGGVSHPPRFLCNPQGLDHGVLIVGMGVHVTKYLHRTQPYWLVKNSWGPDWGEDGYFRIYRGDGTCGVNLMATSSVVE